MHTISKPPVILDLPGRLGRNTGHGFRGLAVRLLMTCLETLAIWQERAAARYRLAEMDDRMLRDIALSRADTEREIRKPFWRP